MTNFLPSQHGLRFRNSFSVTFGISALPVRVPVGYGLCGGISATALDHFRRNRPVPTTTQVPARNTSLYNYLFVRQMNTFGRLNKFAFRFQLWMSWKAGGMTGHRRRTYTEFAKIRAELNKGRPVVIGLVYDSSITKGQVWNNHQVLAYGYSITANGGRLIRIYDPNYLDRNGVPRNDITISAQRVVVRKIGGVRYGYACTQWAGSGDRKTMRGFFMMDNSLGNLNY